jgi:hypothetical protein
MMLMWSRPGYRMSSALPPRSCIRVASRIKLAGDTSTGRR